MKMDGIATAIPQTDIAVPSSIWKYLFIILVITSSPPEDALFMNKRDAPSA